MSLFVMTSSHVSHAEKANVNLTVLPVYKNYKICEFLPRGADFG